MTPPLTVSAAELTKFVTSLFRAVGVRGEEAQVVTDSLVAANLCGHDSHGVMRVAEYIGSLVTSDVVTGAELATVSETPSLLVADAQFGFGQVQMIRLIERLLPKAAATGMACGTMRNCGHVGRLGEWVERVAANGMAALMSVNDNGVLQCVAPPGGVEPRISTNPIAIGVPTGAEPLVLDMSTSVVANGKVRVALSAGTPCPPGWLQDARGEPTTDPHVRLRNPPGTLLPLGGHKGFGLGLLLDILVGGLSGGGCPPADRSARMTNNVLLVVWDPQRCSGSEHFRRQADRLIRWVRNVRKKPGVDAIRLPGDHSAELRKQRLATGIPLDQGTWEELCEMATELHVEAPRIG